MGYILLIELEKNRNERDSQTFGGVIIFVIVQIRIRQRPAMKERLER